MSHVLYVFKDMKVLNYKIHLLISILLLYSVYNDNGTNYHGEILKTHNCVKQMSLTWRYSESELLMSDNILDHDILSDDILGDDILDNNILVNDILVDHIVGDDIPGNDILCRQGHF